MAKERTIRRSLPLAPAVQTDAALPGATAERARTFVPMFKALADETRVEIVALLAANERELCACEIEAHFELSQSTISHHMKILREAGLVRAERRASWVFYALEARALGLLRGFRAALGL